VFLSLLFSLPLPWWMLLLLELAFEYHLSDDELPELSLMALLESAPLLGDAAVLGNSAVGVRANRSNTGVDIAPLPQR